MDATSSKSIFWGSYSYDGLLPEMTRKQKNEFIAIRTALFQIHNSKKNNSNEKSGGVIHVWQDTDLLTGLPNYAFEDDSEFLAETIGEFYATPNIFSQDGEDKKAKDLKIRLYNLYKEIFNIDPEEIRKLSW